MPVREFSQYSNTRIQLNKAKTISPLVTAALESSRDAAELSETTDKLGIALQEIVGDVLKTITPHTANAAMSAVTASALAPLLADAWKRDPDKPSYRHISAAFLSLVRYIPAEPETVFNDTLPRVTSEALAEAKAVSKILPTGFRLEKLASNTRALYLSDLSLEQFQKVCRRDILCLAQTTAQRLEPEDEKQQGIAYLSALNTISDTYASTLAERYNSLTRELVKLKKASPEARECYLQYAGSCPEGPLLEGCRAKVEQVMDTLLYPQMDSDQEASPGM